MPDFNVIEGGGGGRPGDWQTIYARQSFRYLVVEILRGLARGDDSAARIVPCDAAKPEMLVYRQLSDYGENVERAL